MVNNASDSLAQLTERLHNQWRGGNPVAFYDFLVAVRGLIIRQEVDPVEAAQVITGTTFIPGIDDDPLREEITIVAADLETGQPHQKHTWEYLSKLIDELGDQLR